MRVLIAAAYVGRYAETDGVVTTYRHLIPEFVRAGVAADIVAYGPEDRIEETGCVRLFVHRPRLPLRVDSVRRIDAAFAWTALGRRLARVPYSIVQSSTPDPLGVWAGHVARQQGCPFVAIYHTALAEYVAIRATRAAGRLAGTILGGAMARWLRRYFDGADLILTPSQSVRTDLAGRLRPPIDVLGRGVDSVAFHPQKRTRWSSSVRALYVGRVAPEKNLDLLVRLFAGRSDVELVVVGSGPALPALRAQLPGATFTGRLTGEALAGAYADADLFVFPSRTDTLGNVVLEAMASGLPAIVADSMGPKELVAHGSTGFVTHTDAEFAQAVGLLVADAGRRREMGAAARRSAETRSWRAIFEQLIAHYEHVLTQRQVRVPQRRAAECPASTSSRAARRKALAPSRPLCVLDITEFFGETSGGVKTYLTQKACYADRHGVRQVLIVPGPQNRLIERKAARWYQVHGPRIPTQRPYRLMLAAATIRSIIERERPDIVEVGSHFLAPWIASGAIGNRATPVVWFCHSNLPRILAPYPERAHWLRRGLAALSRDYMRCLGRRFAATLAPSDCMAAELKALGVSNVARVSLGVDVECFDPRRRALAAETRRRLGLPAVPLILYAGRITTEKGVDLLLDAWPAIERDTAAHLLLIGDGPQSERLKRRCPSERVHWLAHEADRERLADILAAGDLYVAPSVVETFGLAALEAMASGTPVLSADQGAVAEHVRRSGAGALFVSGSPTHLAAQAVGLLSGRLSAPRARGRAYVTRQLSWAAAFDRIFAVYEQVLHASTRG